jgi:predicted lactoylglutathione lyase
MGLRHPLANLSIVGAVDFVELRDFYRRLGWPQVVDDDDFAAFELRGIVLAIFDGANLAADAHTEADNAGKGIRFAIGVIADTADDVDDLVERMRSAGATVTKEPTDATFFAGRSAYVADPEGNFWEIAWAGPDNPLVMAARRAAGESVTVGASAT